MSDAALSFVIVSVLFWLAVYVGIYLKSWRYWYMFGLTIMWGGAHSHNAHTLSEMSESDVGWLWGCNVLMGIAGYQIYSFWMRRKSQQNVPAISTSPYDNASKSGLSRPVTDIDALMNSELQAARLLQLRQEAQKYPQETAPRRLESRSIRHIASEAHE